MILLVQQCTLYGIPSAPYTAGQIIKQYQDNVVTAEGEVLASVVKLTGPFTTGIKSIHFWGSVGDATDATIVIAAPSVPFPSLYGIAIRWLPHKMILTKMCLVSDSKITVHTHTHTLIVTLHYTCCDEINRTQDLKMCAHADSLILALLSCGVSSLLCSRCLVIQQSN